MEISDAKDRKVGDKDSYTEERMVERVGQGQEGRGRNTEK